MNNSLRKIDIKLEDIRNLVFTLFLIVNLLYVYGGVYPRIVMLSIMLYLTLLLNLKKLRMDFHITKDSIIIILMMLSAILSILIGFKEWPVNYVLRDSRLFTFIPIIYIVIGMSKISHKRIEKSLLVSSFVINFYNSTMILLSILGYAPVFKHSPDWSYSIGLNGVFSYYSPSFQTISFFLVFNIIMFINKKNIAWFIVSMSSILNVIMNQRRAYFILPLLVIFLYLLIGKEYKFKKLLFILISFFCGILLYKLLNIYYMDQLRLYFNLSDLSSDVVRKLQFTELMNMFSKKPIFGWGFGAYVKNFIRNPEMPYSYELTYIAFLMKTGIIGFLIMNGGYSYFVLKKYHSCLKTPLVKAINFGLLSFLLINFTNPYLNISTIVFLFLPFYIKN